MEPSDCVLRSQPTTAGVFDDASGSRRDALAGATPRRDALQSLAALLIANVALASPLRAMHARSAAPLSPVLRTGVQPTTILGRAAVLRPGAATARAPGRVGEFNFLAGSWKISHRIIKANGTDWAEVMGEATCWTILGGIGSVEELRIPANDFSGMGLRLLDVERKEWSDFWCNAKSGVLGAPGTPGSFDDGVGTFIVEDSGNGQPVKIRGVWDHITLTTCRWRQGSSRDGGKTWKDTWIMEWVKV